MGCANSRAKDKQLIIPRYGDPKERQRRSTVHINMSENIRELMLNSGRRTIVFFGKFISCNVWRFSNIHHWYLVSRYEFVSNPPAIVLIWYDWRPWHNSALVWYYMSVIMIDSANTNQTNPTCTMYMYNVYPVYIPYNTYHCTYTTEHVECRV